MNRNSLSFITGVVILLIIVGFIIINQSENQSTVSPAKGSTLKWTTMPKGNSSVPIGITTRSDFATSSPMVVQVQDTPLISLEQAEEIARETFSQLSPDRINITYQKGDRQHQATYDFELFKNNENIVQGGIDPDTGSISSYAIGIKRIGRPEKPVITIEAGQDAAEKEIMSRNGEISLNKTDARYDPLGFPDRNIAGVYVYVYDRLIKNNPCDSDGFTVGVDSISGSVVEYRKTWIKPPEEIC